MRAFYHAHSGAGAHARRGLAQHVRARALALVVFCCPLRVSWQGPALTGGLGFGGVACTMRVAGVQHGEIPAQAGHMLTKTCV